jgi:adenine-specific DNA-methyltransferase
MPQPNRYEQQFLDALKAIFIGAKVEGESGYINLMKIKATYFEGGVFPQLMRDIDAACKPFEKSFREELFDKLYDFFRRYFSESGSIYFRHTATSEGIYERVYTDDRDVVLFWKTHMLYYVKTDRLFNSMEVTVDDERCFFDASSMELKRANEKRELIYEFKRRDPDGRLVFAVAYSEKGRKTKTEDILAAIRKTGAPVDEETLERACRVFEKQSEVDYFINKDAKAFLEEQFDLWLYQYVFRNVGQVGNLSYESAFTETRLKQLQAIKVIAYEIIGFIARFEDELVAVWNKPKFVLNSHYIITLDKILDADAGLVDHLFAHAGMAGQFAEWRELGMLGDTPADPAPLLALLGQKDLVGDPVHARYRFLPLDTKHFPDLEFDILALFPDLDATLDGWLVHSENYQALNTLLPKFRERVKTIYIDPPYNTDAGPIDYVNDYRSSSWLSLVENRLKVSKQVLSDEGIICVTIDDYQVHELAKLLDDIFGRENQLGTVLIRNNPSGRSTVKGISICHEYAFFYQNTNAARLARLPRSDKQLERFSLEVGEHVNWQNFRKGGGSVTYRTERPKQFYPIYVNPKERGLRIPALSWNASKREWNVLESAIAGEVVIWPIDEKGKERVWSLNHESAIANIKDLEVRLAKDDSPLIYRRHKPSEGVLPRSWWDKNTYAAREHGSATLKDLFGESYAFSFAKSPFAVQDCIWVAGLDDDSDNLVLDFFAGSGTTAHAVMNLNRADGGSRKYILVEMGEHFHTVILPRVKKIAFSDKWKDGKANGGQGMSHFVKYFDLEQYEDTLRRADYGDHPAPLFAATLDELARYVFLRDLKLLDAVDVDVPGNRVKVALDKLYPGIDLAETLSCLTGKWIRRITADTVEFADGSTAELAAPAWEDVKALVWW